MHTIEKQIALGRAARKRHPRNAHAAWQPSAGRDAIAIVRETERGRRPNLLPIRHQRMAASPFGFFRGAAAVMAADLAGRPNSGLHVQICGDAHVLNLGAYASPEGHLVFDINDFDETAQGPFEWDLLRFAASLVLAGREAGDSRGRCAASAAAFVRSYRESIASFAAMPFINLERLDVKRIVSAQPVDRILRKAERATPLALRKKLLTSDGRAFRDEPPLCFRLSESEAASVMASLTAYAQTLTNERRFALEHYQPVDVAFKVSGTGSVGTDDFVVLLTGASEADVLFLQVKEESRSCYAPFVASDGVANEGERVVDGQRLMQRASDPLLGWTTIREKDYLVRQLNDHKAAIVPAELNGRSLLRYAEVAGAVFARSHARTGDAAAIAAYCGVGDKLDRAIAQFAVCYADQTAADHARFVKEIKGGA